MSVVREQCDIAAFTYSTFPKSASILGKRQICRRRPRSMQVLCALGASTDTTNQDDEKSTKAELSHQTRIEESIGEKSNSLWDEDWEQLLETPAERTGFDGWREEDDDYWIDFHHREVSFRAPTSFKPEDLKCTKQPLDRDGLPSKYPAAIQYNSERRQWVHTTEEEEEALRQQHPVYDPYFIPEASPDEPYSSFRGGEFLQDKKEIPDENYSEIDSENVTIVMEDTIYPNKDVPQNMSAYRRRRLNLAKGAWRVVHLGTSSAIPTRKRNVSSTAFLTMPEKEDKFAEPNMFLVDAGEGTVGRLVQSDWCITHGFRWIKAIFITHLHGDHIYGLPKLLHMIGIYAQHRRRTALENGDDGSDPVIRIFGPYGTRGFLRASLYWTNPLGVRFSVSELEARTCDFQHLHKSEQEDCPEIIVQTCGKKDTRLGSGLDMKRESPPPHPEEVRAENIHASEDDLWHVWHGDEETPNLEVVAAPLRHRVPCFGYVFREKSPKKHTEDNFNVETSMVKGEDIAKEVKQEIEIDMAKAREMGVYGSQFRVLRSGRSVVASKTGLEVRPEDVVINTVDPPANEERQRKVTILGDTCNSEAIAKAAENTDLLIHEATFANALWRNARRAMHSTAGMAGTFAKQIAARKVALTHFSSRYEAMSWERKGEIEKSFTEPGREEEDDDDMTNPNQLIREAISGYGEGADNMEIIAAYDFLEHNI